VNSTFAICYMPQQPSREAAVAAVDEYGAAWSTQDVARIGRLFSCDAVYVERPGDEAGTFRGRAAIEAYWQRQVSGQQRNIRFRQLDAELLWDERQHTALAKWEAAFEKRRKDGSQNACHFVQVAVLRFNQDGHIEYLEEYWHSTSKQGRVFGAPPAPTLAAEANATPATHKPPVASADSSTSSPIRQNMPQQVKCDYCGDIFRGRNKMFAHLRSGDCVAIAADHALHERLGAASPISLATRQQTRFALLVGYTATAAIPSPLTGVEARLKQSWQQLVDSTVTNESATLHPVRILSRAGATDDGIASTGTIIVLATSLTVDGLEGLSQRLNDEHRISLLRELNQALGSPTEQDEQSPGLVKVLDVTCSRELDATKECQRRRYEYFLPFATLLPTIQDGHHPVTNSGSNGCVQMEEGCWHYTVGSRVTGRFGLRAWPHAKAPKTPWYVCAGDSITVDARLCRDDMRFLRVRVHTHSVGYDCVRKCAVSFPWVFLPTTDPHSPGCAGGALPCFIGWRSTARSQGGSRCTW
jgi:ketosteroid isomerase-like protein